MATIRGDLDSVVAHLPAVKREVSAELDQRAARVAAVVAAHRKTGQLSSTTTSGRTDSVVYLDDPVVVAINYGHWARDGLTWVSGIHAIEAAL